MNNIEILEEWIKIDRKMRNNSTESDYDKFCEEKCIAIENLIQENKELKKENEKNKKLENKIKEILKKDRDCMSLGYYSAYIGLIDDIQRLLYKE